jgi:hypothetical protein
MTLTRDPDHPCEENAMAKSFREWLADGEELYSQALAEYEALGKQLEDLEARLGVKKEEVNQVAAMIGKPPVEGNRKAPAVEIVDSVGPGSSPSSRRNIIAKALTGRLTG